jgi:hypothetical protein
MHEHFVLFGLPISKSDGSRAGDPEYFLDLIGARRRFDKFFEDNTDLLRFKSETERFIDGLVDGNIIYIDRLIQFQSDVRAFIENLDPKLEISGPELIEQEQLESGGFHGALVDMAIKLALKGQYPEIRLGPKHPNMTIKELLNYEGYRHWYEEPIQNPLDKTGLDLDKIPSRSLPLDHNGWKLVNGGKLDTSIGFIEASVLMNTDLDSLEQEMYLQIMTEFAGFESTEYDWGEIKELTLCLKKYLNRADDVLFYEEYY